MKYLIEIFHSFKFQYSKFLQIITTTTFNLSMASLWFNIAWYTWFLWKRKWRKRCDNRPLRAPDTTMSFPWLRNFPLPRRSFLVVPDTSFPCCKKESIPQVHCSRSSQVQVFRPLFMPRPSLFMWAKWTSAKNANTTTLRSIERFSRTYSNPSSIALKTLSTRRYCDNAKSF